MLRWHWEELALGGRVATIFGDYRVPQLARERTLVWSVVGRGWHYWINILLELAMDYLLLIRTGSHSLGFPAQPEGREWWTRVPWRRKGKGRILAGLGRRLGGHLQLPPPGHVIVGTGWTPEGPSSPAQVSGSPSCHHAQVI